MPSPRLSSGMRKSLWVVLLVASGVLAATLVLRAQTRTAAVPSRTDTYERYAEGLYARRLFSAPSPGRDYAVEVWRFSVPPRTRSAEIVLPGAAAITVHLGAVSVLGSGKQQELRLGGSLLLEEGERVAFANGADRPANLRVVIFRGEG